MVFSLRSVCLLVFSLVLSSFGSALPVGSNPFNCENVTTLTSFNPSQDCQNIEYCYWDSGTCKKDDCLEALNKFNNNIDDEVIDDTCSETGCFRHQYKSTNSCVDGVDGGNAVTTTNFQGYCSRKSVLPYQITTCHYEFVKSLGTCNADMNCQNTPYNESTGKTGRLRDAICVSKPECEALGIGKCHTNPSCVILGGQCVKDICYLLSTYNPNTYSYGDCTKESTTAGINYRAICKEYPLYKHDGTGANYKVEKSLVCGSKFGKYLFSGDNLWNNPDPCANLPASYSWKWADTEDDSHGCPDPNNFPDPTKCVQKQCDSYSADDNCTSANTISDRFARVTCRVVNGKCTDGRPATHTPSAESCLPAANAASVFSSASVFIVLLLTTFIALLFI